MTATPPTTKPETLFALAPGPMRKRDKPLPSQAEIKRQIREVEADIDDLEDDLSDARNKLDKLEEQLRHLQKTPASEVSTTSRMARQILALPFVPGFLRELAMRAAEEGADDQDAEIIAGYFEQREREAALAQAQP